MTALYLRRSIRALAALGLAALALTEEIEIPFLVLGAAAWLISFYLDERPQLQRPLRRAESISAIVIILWSIADFYLRKSTVFLTVAHFLILFQALKLLGLKERRDCLQIMVISFFQILASCALSVEISEGLILFLFIPMATAALFWHHLEWEQSQSPNKISATEVRSFRKVAWAMCAGALPINLALTAAVFVLFPRLTLNASLPGFGNAIMGYTNHVNLNRTGSLQDQPQPVLWLDFPSAEDRRAWDGYLRGGTLDHFDGQEWTPDRAMRTMGVPIDLNHVFRFRRPKRPGAFLRSTITLVETGASTLFLPGEPLEITAPLSRLEEGSDGSVRWTQPWNKPLRYDAITLQTTGEGLLLPLSNDADRDLPSAGMTRVAALAKQVGGQGAPMAQAERIETYLKKNYHYDLDYGMAAEEYPVDYFLFTGRHGPCTYFASAMAVMLRLQGIQCRLVSGFLRGEWNAPAKEYLIRERDAHSWVEVYQPGLGWQRFDPSPSGAPASTSHLASWRFLMQYMDYLQLLWNRVVIQYDLYAQVRAFERVKESSDSLNHSLAIWWSHHQMHFQNPSTPTPPERETSSISRQTWILLCVSFGLAGVALFWFNRRSMHYPTDSEVAAYHQFLRDMARDGVAKTNSETGLDYVRRLSRQHPEHHPNALRITTRYYTARFSKLVLLILGISLLGHPLSAWADDTEANLPSLIRALKSSDPDQCERAAEAIKEIGPGAKAAIPALRKTLGSDLPYVRQKSAEALASIGTPAVPALIEALSNDSSDVRTIAAGALASLGSDAAPAASALAHALEDSDFTVRASATNALEKIGTPGVPAILPLFKSDSAQTRTVAIRTVSAIHPSDDRVISALVGLLKDEDPQVRLTAVKALGRQGKAAVPTLTKSLDSSDASVRAELCDILGDIGRPSASAVPGLTTALKDSEASVRASAATALGKIGSASLPAVPTLKTLLQDSNPDVATKAQEALTNLTALFGNKEEKPQVATTFDSGPVAAISISPEAQAKIIKRKLHHKAVMAKAKIAPKKKLDPAIAKWIKQLGNDDDVERLEASQSLVGAGSKAVEGLIDSVHHSTDSVRVLSCSILGKIGPVAEPAVPTLTEMLDDENPDIQQSAALALVRIDTMTAFKVLGDMARSDPDPARRVIAINTLGETGPTGASAVPILADVLKDSNTALSDKAALALSQIGTPEANSDVKNYNRLQVAKAVQTAVRELRAHGSDIDPRAVDELLKIGSVGVIPMSQSLKDPNPKVRGGVARALNHLGRDATPATGAIIAALDDEDVTVRHEAAESLGKIDTQDAQSALRFFSIKDWYKTEMQHFKH